MNLRITTAAAAAALALLATPAFAAKPATPGAGKATAPGQVCKGQSHKKTNHGKGKSPFAACVVGATRAQHEIAEHPTTTAHTAPAKLCKGQSHKKAGTDAKSPFAACVSGAAKAQREDKS